MVSERFLLVFKTCAGAILINELVACLLLIMWQTCLERTTERTSVR